MFEKFDAAGDDLFSLIHCGIHKRHEIFQMRFINVSLLKLLSYLLILA